MTQYKYKEHKLDNLTEVIDNTVHMYSTNKALLETICSEYTCIDNNITVDDKTIQKFVKSKLFSYLVHTNNVIAVTLGGSHAIGLADDNSDYDLTFIVDDNKNDMSSTLYSNDVLCCKIDGKFIHWFFTSYSCCTSLWQVSKYSLVKLLYFYDRFKYSTTVFIGNTDKYNAIHSADLDSLCIKANYIICRYNWANIISPIAKSVSLDIGYALWPKILYNMCIIACRFGYEWDKDLLINTKRLAIITDTAIKKATEAYVIACMVFLYNKLKDEDGSFNEKLIEE